MENCFRFLINMDQCLNMSYFDIFFYKLESQHKFHMSQVQMSGSDGEASLHSAIMDIRMYLDKYPYHVGDCQIIVTMRSKYQRQICRWKDTMLYRLLLLRYELNRARIYINSRERVERALNFIMLYDADFDTDLSDLADYFSSRRFRDDCEFLLDQIGGHGATQEQLVQLLQDYRQSPDWDPVTLDFMECLCNSCRKSVAGLDEQSDLGVESDMPLDLVIPPFLKENLINFQVFETAIDRNNRRQNILALLRVVDFINMPVERAPMLDGHVGVVPLAQQCASNWNRIWDDVTLEERYAAMLCKYQRRLNNAVVELEKPRYITPSSTKLPEEKIPNSNAIKSEDSVFSDQEKANEHAGNLKKILTDFRDNSVSGKSVVEQWAATHNRLKNSLGNMDLQLKRYAEGLGRKYAATLEQRKSECAVWRTNFYTADQNTEDQIVKLEYEQERLLQELKSPRMTPSLRFQDQLNMENALEESNLKIKHLAQCLRAITAGNFLALVGACLVMFVLHYTLLQPYAFQGVNTLAYYLVYIAAVFVLMLLTWRIPYQHFRKELRRCVDALIEDMERYISGYFEKADQFCEYINLLNRLDYINRYLQLLKRAHAASKKLSQGYLWHKVQVRTHLSKLQFFQGLVELGAEKGEGIMEDESVIPTVDGNRVSDVIDSTLYWPQS